MAGVDVILDLVMKNLDSINGQKFDSNKLATSLAVATYLAYRSALSGSAPSNAGPTSCFHRIQYGSFKLSSKQYNIQLEPIYSALKWDALGLTWLKSLTKFLPLLKSPSPMKDLVAALWDAAKYIFFEVMWTTTRRLLEKLAVLCFSPRIAWKLVRDVAASVTRMAVKGVSGFKYIFGAAKTTFLGDLTSLGTLVHLDKCSFTPFSYLNRECYWSFGIMACSSWPTYLRVLRVRKGDHPVDTWERVWILGKKILGTTVTCIISFIFACICAAIGALIFGSIGTWIGAFTLPFVLAWIAAKLFCPAMGLLFGFAFGDFAGNALISFCLEKLGL